MGSGINNEGETSVTSVAEQRLMLALEAAELGTWTWDMASATTVWDARLEALHGLPPGGFGGTFDDWVAALYPDDRAECLRRVERALADPGPYRPPPPLHLARWLHPLDRVPRPGHGRRRRRTHRHHRCRDRRHGPGAARRRGRPGARGGAPPGREPPTGDPPDRAAIGPGRHAGHPVRRGGRPNRRRRRLVRRGPASRWPPRSRDR